nr:receptor-like serine/threonine-protein kinase At4g25390 [Tanacetum cinerariifolium]
AYADESWNIGLVTYIKSLSNMTTQSNKLGLQIEEGKKMVVDDNGSVFKETELGYYNIAVDGSEGNRKRGVGARARAWLEDVGLISGWMDLVVSFGMRDTIVMILSTFMSAKNPALQPSMKEILAMLTGDLELPPLRVEYSLSPPSRFKSHRKAQRPKVMVPKELILHLYLLI